ncbi:MAG: hypothetical protein SGILL_008573, partial [Bacillariaceae sp.]
IAPGLGKQNDGLIITGLANDCISLFSSYKMEEEGGDGCPPLQKQKTYNYFKLKQWGPEV